MYIDNIYIIYTKKRTHHLLQELDPMNRMWLHVPMYPENSKEKRKKRMKRVLLYILIVFCFCKRAACGSWFFYVSDLSCAASQKFGQVVFPG